MTMRNSKNQKPRSQSRPLETTILDLMDTIFARWFRGPSWDCWRVLLAVLFGLHDRIDAHGIEIYRAATGRDQLPTQPIKRLDLIVGRRGGKSLIAAFIALFVAFFVDHSAYLQPGERAVVSLMAADKVQAGILLRYIKGFVKSIPALRALVVRELREGLELANGVSIEVRSASFKMGARGFSLCLAVNDEVAFWESDETSAEPDVAIIGSQRPSLATIPTSIQLNVSSPHSRRGHLWNSYQQNWGKDVPGILVWKAASRRLPDSPGVEMNSSLDIETVRAAYEQDASAAAADFGAEFRTDLESVFSREAIAACVIAGRFELPPSKTIQYFAFADPSGGSSDSFTLAISHVDAVTNRVILDLVRERRAKFSPDEVVKEFAAVLKSYACDRVTGDRYAAEWPVERFLAHGICYVPSSMTKSELYLAALPLVNSGRCELLDSPRLTAQFIALERRTSRGGRDSVDHPPSGHDDVANAVAGALVAVPLAVREPWSEVLQFGQQREDGPERLWTKVN
jgi:hypothetical protein